MIEAIYKLACLSLGLVLVPLTAWLIFSVRKSSSQLKQRALRVAFATLAFCCLDWALLAALPGLDLSFGPVLPPLVGLSLFRVGLYLAWMITWLLACRPTDNPKTAQASAWGLLLLNLVQTILVVYAFYYEPFDLHVSNIRLPLRGVSPGNSLRIVQLSDIHVERNTARETRLIPLVNSLKPDLIVLTGDYVNLSYLKDPQAIREARAVLAQLHAPYGVYAVNGTVDGSEQMKLLFENLDIVVLDDSIHKVQFGKDALFLLGVTNHSRGGDDRSLASLVAEAPPGAAKVLLYHTPDLAEAAAGQGVDLYFAGHTHGGQIRLPFYGALITFSSYGKKYERGLYHIGPTTLYVSSGIGMEGSAAPRARFLCPPEVVAVDLVPEMQQ